MKKGVNSFICQRNFLILFFLASFFQLSAQKCLDINIVTLMGKLETPGNAAASFSKCRTSKNDEHQLTITDYGSDLVDLDSMEARTAREFNYAVISGSDYSTMHAPSQDQAEAIKADAEKLKTMTPEQQRAYAMQMSQKYGGGNSKPLQDDAATIQTVMKAQNIAVIQMKTLDDEFANKIRASDKSASDEIAALPRADKSKCPQNKQGMVLCSCANEAESAYWEKAILIRDKYNSQKIAIYQSYLTRIKALAGQVDDIVGQFKYGETLRSVEMKKMLLSSQSAAFANAFVESTLCVEGIRKSGSDLYINKVNSDNGVYDLSCSR
jgi:hypothetical protein